MYLSKTVVINCAGIGSRLGLGKTKALIEIGEKPIIAWHLDMLKEVEDIRVVVGFQAEQVIEAVLSIRKDITFVFNHDYHSTGTAHSFYLGARYARDWIISLDGDLLINPTDFHQFIKQDGNYLGFCEVVTQEPVYVNVMHNPEGPLVTAFSRESGKYEWTGLLQIARDELKNFTGTHIFEACQSKLPIKGVLINAREIDTPEDFDRAVIWMNELMLESTI